MAETVRMIAYMDEDKIIESISDSISHEGIVEFIKKLEKSYQDWDVTEALYEYFKGEMEILWEEDK